MLHITILNKFLDLVAFWNIKFPTGIDVTQTKSNLNDLSIFLRQDLWHKLQDIHIIATHCINHSLGQGDIPQCVHEYASCSTCNNILLSLDAWAEVKQEIDALPVSILPSIEKGLITKEHELDVKNVIK